MLELGVLLELRNGRNQACLSRVTWPDSGYYVAQVYRTTTAQGETFGKSMIRSCSCSMLSRQGHYGRLRKSRAPGEKASGVPASKDVLLEARRCVVGVPDYLLVSCVQALICDFKNRLTRTASGSGGAAREEAAVVRLGELLQRS